MKLRRGQRLDWTLTVHYGFWLAGDFHAFYYLLAGTLAVGGCVLCVPLFVVIGDVTSNFSCRK